MTRTDTLLERVREQAGSLSREELVDARDVVIDRSLPPGERVRDFVRQIKNPYHFHVGDVEVRVAFKGEATLDECLQHYLDHTGRDPAVADIA